MATDIGATALHLARRAALRQVRAAERAARLRGCLPAAAAVLKGHGAQRVLVFGSLTTGRATEEVVRGPVDLVRLEEAPPSLVERIAAEGLEL